MTTTLPQSFKNLEDMYDYAKKNDLDVNFDYAGFCQDKICGYYSFEGNTNQKYVFDSEDNFVKMEA